MAYEIKRWLDVFERHDRRRVRRLEWTSLPVDLGSTGIRVLLGQGANGLQALGLFVALVEVVGELPASLRDGRIMRPDGTEHSIETLARKLSLSIGVVQQGLERLSHPDVGWLQGAETNRDHAVASNGMQLQEISPTRQEQDTTGQDKNKDIGSADFQTFWDAYDYKTNRGGAERAWRKVPARERQLVIDAVLAQKQPGGQLDKNTRFKVEWGKKILCVPHPATWLSNRRWEDEVVVLEAATSQKTVAEKQRKYTGEMP